METEQIVIIGASLAGAKAAETLREAGFSGAIALVGTEDELPYERPPLSKGYLLGKEPREGGQVHDADWYAAQHVDLHLGRTATALDTKAHTVTLDDGTVLNYGKALLATGSRVRTLDVGGSDNAGVYSLRTVADADRLKAVLKKDTQVVVVGAGWIGLETAAAAREHGCTVTVIEVEQLPLQRVLGDEVATLFRDLHQAHGVTFHFGVGVREFGGLDGHVTDVVLENGVEIAADVVIVGVGIRPATELAEAAGLTIDNGVAVDENLRTSDPDVYACGDVASWPSKLTGTRLRVEHWGNALKGGPAAAKNMIGQGEPYDPVPYFFSDQYDLGMEYAGWAARHGYDRIVTRGELSVADGKAPECVVFWVRDGHVLAGMNINVWDVQDDLQALVRAGYEGRAVDLDRLADPNVPLGELLT